MKNRFRVSSFLLGQLALLIAASLTPQMAQAQIVVRDSFESCSSHQEVCADDLACYRYDSAQGEAQGMCLPREWVEDLCIDSGGDWGRWGFLGHEFCNQKFSDAGQRCTDSSQCQGDCLLFEYDEPAECQTYHLQFGCFARLDKDSPFAPEEPMMLCVD